MDEQIKSSNEAYKNKIKFNEYLKMSQAAFANKNYDISAENIKKALEIFPDNLDAREIAADILWIKGNVSSASLEYKSIFDSDNTRIKVEEKYAKTVLSLYDKKQKIQSMEDLLNKKEKINNKTSTGKVFLSAIIPGLSAMLDENFVKGIIIFLLYFAFIGMAIKGTNSSDFSEIFKSFYFYLAIIIWFYSFVDAIIQYKKNK